MSGIKPNLTADTLGLLALAKVTALKSSLDDPGFPLITYRRGASSIPTPVIRGTGIRVETIVVAHQRWGQKAIEWQNSEVLLAHRSSFSLADLIRMLDCALTTTVAEDFTGQVRWLSDWNNPCRPTAK